MRILVVEDPAEAAVSVVEDLERSGYQVVVAWTGAEALEAYADVDLVLMDLALPDFDGVEMCRRLRSSSEVPIIAFTDRGELDRVLGLRAGADDCLNRSCSFRELLARIEAVWRRAWSHRSGRPRDDSVAHGGLRIDPATRQVFVQGRPVDLTRKEFDLLYHLARNSGVVVTRQRLMAEIFHAGTRGSRTIDTHVSALRGKLGCGWILTVRGVGFRFGHD